ncbi:MAG TPA: diguanylate cyclase, partial [Smithellaceae bacterium]|nr:diguanylate cyclase [Smithellaceae bacterium]
FGAWAANNGFRTGVSFGLAVVPKGKNNLDDILRQADAALYDAKPKECEISKASAPSRIPDKMRG